MLGNWLAICDRCGGQFYASQLRREWTGLMVCSADYDVRHPQEFVRGVPERMSVPWARPEAPETFVDIGVVTLTEDTVSEAADIGTLVGLLSVSGMSGETFLLTDNAEGRFALDPSDTSRLLIGPAGLDYEAGQEHSITVRPLYGAPTSFIITVTDADERMTVEGDFRSTVDGYWRVVIEVA